MHFTTLLLAFASYVAAQDIPCPKGYTQYKLNFNNLGKNIGNKTHAVLPKQKGVLGGMWWSETGVQVVSPGYTEVKNGFHRPNKFEMTTHQGQGALVSTQEWIDLLPDGDNDVFNLQSFWVRHQLFTGFDLNLLCYVWKDGWVRKEFAVTVPEKPLEQYGKVQLTKAQQTMIKGASSCNLRVLPRVGCEQCEFDTALFIDDLNYCFKKFVYFP